MLQLKCIGLNLSPLNSLEYAEGSIDVPVKIEFDNTYADHTKVLHVGYYDGNGAERGAKASLENDVFKIPGPVFAQSGIIFLSVHFSKTGESSEPETKPVYYQVQKTAGGVGSLPASYIWEPVVKRYVQEVIDNGDITFSTDSTLSKPGQAADAKVVGEEIEQLKKDKVDKTEFEQLKGTIDDLKENGVSGGSGLNANAKNLLITILRNGLYNVDQSENITKLETALGSSGGDEPIIPDEPDTPTPTKYTITNLFTNVTSNNSNTSIEENTSYSATLTPNEGYMIDSIVVIMGDEDITSTVVANGVITIPSVTANVEITAIAIEEQKEATLIEDGLVAYFDLRNINKDLVNTASLPGGGCGLPTATKGSASLYSWGAWCEESDDYGVRFKRVCFVSDENTTTNKTFNGDFTFVSLSKGMGYSSFGYGTNGNNMRLQPSYKNSSSVVKLPQTMVYDEGSEKLNDKYRTVGQRISNNNLDIFVDGEKVYTFDGTQYDDFVSWEIVNSIGVSPYGDSVKLTAFAIFNRALSDVEIMEMQAFLETLEVVA